MSADYPRDLIGYGNNPPHPQWPGNARIALSFVLNYEEGGERNILHGDKESEAFLSEMVAAQPLQGQRNMSMESLYEYGSRAGVWRLLKLFKDSGVPLTVFAVAMAAQRHPDVIRAMVAALPEGDGPLAQLHALSAAISDAVQYRSGVTGADTTAAQAFALGAGVCQDHAQIFLAGARLLGVPARYVSGYLLASEGDLLHETHGWAEALVPGLGWVGFDPSNRVCVTERYLRLASGLDADEAAPIRGSVTVAGYISIDADVRIAQAEDGVEERQLQRQQQQSTPTPRS